MADTPRSHGRAAAATPITAAGGFVLPNNPFSSLPSPSPSTASSRIAARLPHPRSKPLAPGSRKEDYARSYVSERLLHISRRFVKKHGIPDPADEVAGYETMDEVCRDLEEVIDVLWFSGTPSLQVTNFLNVALAFNTYLPSFPPSPRPTFMLLKKLDHCFASLLVGYDIKSKDPLPGFQRGLSAGLSRTEMVRCKSLADETRMLVAMVMSGEADVDNYSSDEDEFVKPARKKMEAPKFVETVAVEEIYDEDGDDEDREQEETKEPTTTRKRKAGDLSYEEEQDNIDKRLKVEYDTGPFLEPGDVGGTEGSPEAANVLSTTANDGNTGQFHWALDDDDDDDDDDDNDAESEHETIPNSITKATSVPEEAIQATLLPEQTADEEEGDGSGDESSDSDGDEEMHLNVGKVYSKTLVQLGKSLGESLINNDNDF